MNGLSGGTQPVDEARVPFSVECIVLGRNDDYEPDWAAKLEGAIRHNRSLFEKTRVNFSVAFVEWNPPRDKPLLGPELVRKYPFVRAVVVDPQVHAQLCEVPDLQIMLNFACNAALRTTAADYALITGGDDFIGQELARRIVREGLKPGCLYRAERVNVRQDLDFTNPTIDSLENPDNIVAVDSCSEPPYDTPPYTNASGDFLLLDAGTMSGLRGLDESITFARLHLDSRFCANAMAVVEDCQLLGRIFHINHKASYNNRKNVPGRSYNWDWALPYVNSPDWGLAHYAWMRDSERLYHVRPSGGRMDGSAAPDNLSTDARERALLTSARLAVVRATVQTEEPGAMGQTLAELNLTNLYVQEDWGSSIVRSDEGIGLQTGLVQWGYAAAIPVTGVDVNPESWYWLVVRMAIERGALGVGFFDEGTYVGERFVTGPDTVDLSLPMPAGANSIVFRNVAEAGTRTEALVCSAKIVSLPKRAASG